MARWDMLGMVLVNTAATLGFSVAAEGFSDYGSLIFMVRGTLTSLLALVILAVMTFVIWQVRRHRPEGD